MSQEIISARSLRYLAREQARSSSTAGIATFAITEIKNEEEEVYLYSIPPFIPPRMSRAAIENRRDASTVLAPVVTTEFTLFPKLPTELQIMVWEFARPPPRVIKPLLSKDGHSLYSPAQIPSILHTCHLSRKTAQKSYTLGLATWMGPQYFNLVKGRIWFDNERDILYVPTKDSQAWKILYADSKNIRNVAWEVWSNMIVYSFFSVELQFETVRELLVVDRLKCMEGPWGWAADFTEMDAFEWQGGRSLMEERAEEIKAQEGMNLVVKWSLERATRVGFANTSVGES